MKKKLRILGHLGLAVFLVSALLLTAVPLAKPAQAVGTAVTDVWVDFPSADNPNEANDSGGTNEYLVHFKPYTALSRGVDWVTVTFPDGVDSDMGPTTNGDFTIATVDAADANFSTNFGTAFSATWIPATVDATINNYRVKVRMPIDVAAGADVWLSLSSTGIVSNTTESNSYKVYVQTTKDTARVLSSAFSLGNTDLDEAIQELIVTPTTVGVTAEYKLKFQPTTPGATTVTVKLPMGVGMPSSMDTTEVLFSEDGSSWFNASSTPVVDVARRTVTAATSLILDSGSDNYMKIIQGAGVTNPTTAGAAYEAVMKTTDDAQWLSLNDESEIVADTATKLVFVAATSDDATIVNAFTKVIKLESHDQYGNKKAVTGTTVLVATNGTGTVHTATGSSNPWGTSQSHGGGSVDVYYLPTVVGTGTHTLTATVVSGTPLDLATFDVSVVPKVVLTDSDGNELGTYGPSFSYTANIKSADYIEDAINAAGAGDTVTLGDGIYEMWEGNIGVDKAITVTSVNGADFTTIRRRHTGGGVSIFELSSRATISGLHLLGYLPGETQLFEEDKFGVLIAGDGTAENYGYVKNNIIEGFEVGIGNADRQADYWKIQDNVIDNNRVGIYGDLAMDFWIISGNTITNYYVGIARFSATVTSLTIKNNNLNGINSSVLTKILDEGNEVTGIQLNRSDANIVITQNTFTANDYGIKLNADAAATVVKYNDFIDNNLFGIGASSGSYDVYAELNWWGDATGPSTGTGTYASTATGSGDAISADVDPYSPWLHKSKVDVVADNADYLTFTQSLAVGWNTLSTPVPLMSDMNSIDELIPSGLNVGYYYDAGWQQITTGHVLSPVDAVYLKMSLTKYVLLKFNAKDFSTPSKSLAAGWNLISLALLSSSGQDADDAVASVKLTAAGLPGYSQVISPSMNANQTDMYGNAGTSWVVASGQDEVSNKMQAGLGYWIYMQNAATLAGSELTPITPDLD